RDAQEVLILHHLLGLSFKEVGQVIGIAPGTAKVRAHRALKSLRERLETAEVAS
ncbi:MAG: RNA polymerase sigma factor, partial [Verrucomicrobiota bacterium]